VNVVACCCLLVQRYTLSHGNQGDCPDGVRKGWENRPSTPHNASASGKHNNNFHFSITIRIDFRGQYRQYRPCSSLSPTIQHQNRHFEMEFEENNNTSSTQSDHRTEAVSAKSSSPLDRLPCNASYTHSLFQIYILKVHTLASITNPISAYEILFHNPSLRPTIVLRPPNPLPPSTTTDQPPRINNMTALKCQRERLSLRICQNERVR
jgi:hypothetical protein